MSDRGGARQPLFVGTTSSLAIARSSLGAPAPSLPDDPVERPRAPHSLALPGGGTVRLAGEVAFTTNARAVAIGLAAGLRGWRHECRAASGGLDAAIVFEGADVVLSWRTIAGVSGRRVIRSDDDAIGRLAADHLRACALPQVAVVGRQGRGSDERLRGFCAVVGPTEVLRLPAAGSREAEVTSLARFLDRLPAAAGLFACDDELGALALEACARLGIAVPDELAVVGAGDDELRCLLTPVPLSSVQLDGETIGRRAAELLEAVAQGGAVAAIGDVVVPPRAVVTRASTDQFACDEPHVSTAMRLIRARACDGIGAIDVIASVPMSRRVLEKRFRAVVGRTIHDEILRVRLERVKQLLRTTPLPLAAIGEQTGFANVEHLSRLFKKRVGSPPSVFRATAEQERSSW